MIGGTGSDRIKGRGGDDWLGDKGGYDCLLGNAGNDRIYAADGRRDVVRCGRGHDFAIVDGADRIRSCERVIRR
jgi:RTX calcium-binding nonapeptide repeat (4 copies)